MSKYIPTKAFGTSGNWKLKWKAEMVKMKIIYFLIHTSLKGPPVNKTTRITVCWNLQYARTLHFENSKPHPPPYDPCLQHKEYAVLQTVAHAVIS